MDRANKVRIRKSTAFQLRAISKHLGQTPNTLIQQILIEWITQYRITRTVTSKTTQQKPQHEPMPYNNSFEPSAQS